MFTHSTGKTRSANLATASSNVIFEMSKDPNTSRDDLYTIVQHNSSIPDYVLPFISSHPNTDAGLLAHIVTHPNTDNTVLAHVVAKDKADATVLRIVAESALADEYVLGKILKHPNTNTDVLQAVASNPNAHFLTLAVIASQTNISNLILKLVAKNPKATINVIDTIAKQPNADADLLLTITNHPLASFQTFLAVIHHPNVTDPIVEDATKMLRKITGLPSGTLQEIEEFIACQFPTSSPFNFPSFTPSFDAMQPNWQSKDLEGDNNPPRQPAFRRS